MILIAGGKQDFDSEESKSIDGHFDRIEVVYEHIKQADEFDYSDIEAQIEKCETFLVLIGSELNSSTWLNHCLTYAFKMVSRPRIVGYLMDGWVLPVCAQHLKAEMEVISKIEDFK